MSYKLTLKQRKFKDNYIKSGNGTQSVIDAGYNCKDKSVAKAIACENLTKPYIREEIEAEQADSKARVGFSKEERLKSLAGMALEEHKTPITARDKIQAIAEINRMCGDYPPERHAVIGDIRINVRYIDKEIEANSNLNGGEDAIK